MSNRIKFGRTIHYTALVLILLTGCNAEPDSTYPKAAEQNMDVDLLGVAIDSLSDIPGFKSIVLGRNGDIAVEKYFNYGQINTPHDVRSVTKSIMALLIGIAIREGYIQSEEQVIGDYLTGLAAEDLEPQLADITIGHLLTMSCGLEWHELDGGNSYGQWYGSGDHINWVLSQPFIHEPGAGFNYNTGSTYLLSVILTQATEKSALEFAQTYLFEPMGITSSDWDVLPYGGLYNNGGAGLNISARSMFALGNLVLNQGLMDQNQIVPADWISKCVANQNPTDGSNPYGTDYGYLWWLGEAHNRNHYYAMGWGGQFIVCVPELDLVVVTTCEWRGVSSSQARQNWYDIFMLIMDSIIPAVRDD